MLFEAEKLAARYGYIEVDRRTIKSNQDDFWGNTIVAIVAYAKKEKMPEVQACRYIKPVFDEDRNFKTKIPNVDIDMYWGNPRISVITPDGAFACLTYEDDICKDVQALGEKGVNLLLEIKNDLDRLIREN